MTPVVRRSALEAAHMALGARWLADDVRWPDGYSTSDAAADAAAVAAGAGLAEIGPFAELLLRGPGALAGTASLATGGEAAAAIGRALAADLGGEAGEAWLLGPDEVLLLGPVSGSWPATLASRLASDEVSAIEMTGARTALRLAGPSAAAILAELCPSDTTPETTDPGDLIQAPLAGVRAFIARQAAGYTIMVARDEATYVWDALIHVGTAHGLTPVGPAAVTTR